MKQLKLDSNDLTTKSFSLTSNKQIVEEFQNKEANEITLEAPKPVQQPASVASKPIPQTSVISKLNETKKAELKPKNSKKIDEINALESCEDGNNF